MGNSEFEIQNQWRTRCVWIGGKRNLRFIIVAGVLLCVVCEPPRMGLRMSDARQWQLETGCDAAPLYSSYFGNAVLKLYQRQNDPILFWETWESAGQTCLHFGAVGERGETLWFGPELREAIAARLEKNAAELRERGYAELAPDEYELLVVQYHAEAWGNLDNHSKRIRLENALDECLGWTGNGYCDGTDIAPPLLSINCLVVNAMAALEPIIAMLRREDALGGALLGLAKTDGELQPLWPAVTASGEHSSVT